MNDLKDIPATKEYLELLAKKILYPVLEIPNISVLGIYKNGTESMLKYLVFASDKQLPKIYQKLSTVTWFFLEVSEVDSDSFFQMKKEGDGHENEILSSADVYKLADSMSKCFIINNSELLLQNKSHISLIKHLKEYSRVILLFNKEISKNELDIFLSVTGISTRAYAPMRSEKDVEVLLDKEEKWFNYQLGVKQKKQIVNMTDGFTGINHPLMAVCKSDKEKFLKLKIDDLIEEKHIINRLDDIFNSFISSTKKDLIRIAVGSILYEDVDEYLSETDFVEVEKDFAKIKVGLFEKYLQKKFGSAQIKKSKSGTLSKLGINLQNLLTNQEYVFLLKLSEARGYITREQVAEIIWGVDWRNKYSDWAIDKIVSRIRKKIFDQNKEQLVSIKRKGIKLIAS